MKPQREIHLPFSAVKHIRKKSPEHKKEIFELFRDAMCCYTEDEEKDAYILFGLEGFKDMTDVFKIKTVEELKKLLEV